MSLTDHTWRRWCHGNRGAMATEAYGRGGHILVWMYCIISYQEQNWIQEQKPLLSLYPIQPPRGTYSPRGTYGGLPRLEIWGPDPLSPLPPVPPQGSAPISQEPKPAWGSLRPHSWVLLSCLCLLYRTQAHKAPKALLWDFAGPQRHRHGILPGPNWRVAAVPVDDWGYIYPVRKPAGGCSGGYGGGRGWNSGAEWMC